MTRQAAGLGAASVVVATAALVTAAPSAADYLPLRHVKYTITAENPIYAEIYYLDQEPEVFAYWSHNPYQYMPNIEVDLVPNKPWTFELGLRKPEQWAMVMANTGPEPSTPNFHCQIEVDGVLVKSNEGPRGVLCSIRSW
jgi:hypothetical protein